MRHRDRSIARIIYGTAWKKTDTRRLVEIAIQEGFRGIDTACQPKHYDEAGVGAGVAACLNLGLARRDLYLQTKFTPVSGQNPRQIPYDTRSETHMREDLSIVDFELTVAECRAVDRIFMEKA